MAMLLFAPMLFLLSAIIWRIDGYLSGRHSRTPLGTVSIIFMVAGIAALFHPIWFLFSENVRELFFYGMMLTGFVLWVMLAVFLHYKGGMKFIFTNRRIITAKRFMGVDINEHPYDRIMSVELHQGILGRHFGYGDLRFRVKRGKSIISFSVHGVKNPVLVKNTVIALSRNKKRSKVKSLAKKSKAEKRPKKPPKMSRKTIYYLKPY
jgi:uncharacterized membrane protein YdbT with pleckstrin-like domain